MSAAGFASVEDALDALRDGRPVLVLDDEDRENEGDVILAAQSATSQWVGWAIRNTSGYLCAPMPRWLADRLELPLMVSKNEDPFRTAYTVTVDAATGVSTGISASDRAHTLRVLADPTSQVDDLIRPGHVVPLRARDGGVLERTGHTEAAVDLCRLAGLEPVGALAELVNDEGEMLRTPEVLELGHRDGLPVITIAELVRWRAVHDRVRKAAVSHLPTTRGVFAAHAYRDLITGAEHVALVAESTGDVIAPIVRVHSECLTGEAFGSLRCDCGPQLDDALARVAEAGGVVVYLGGHEGRGVGLIDKIRAYGLQDAGMDTVDAQTALGLPVDAREYGAAAAILTDLGIGQVQLITHNPAKVDALQNGGIRVVRMIPSRVSVGAEAAGYLATKRSKLGHSTLTAGVSAAEPTERNAG